jgi:eukaryotic-like serine/threonine-protein kinase
VPRTNLGAVVYPRLGQYKKALEECREALRIAPTSGLAHAILTEAYLRLNRPEEAQATAAEAQAKKLDSPARHLHAAAAALAFSKRQGVQYGAGLALALAGDANRSQSLADALAKRFPQDTIVRFNYVPTLQAQLALTRNEPSKAIEVLQANTAYELGIDTALYPLYVRGEAYLVMHQGSEAAAEFQKILDHRGLVLNDPIGALAHLGLARAYAMQGDIAKAKEAYQDFLTLWKDADPDIPILIAAKAEYAKLK